MGVWESEKCCGLGVGLGEGGGGGVESWKERPEGMGNVHVIHFKNSSKDD